MSKKEEKKKKFGLGKIISALGIVAALTILIIEILTIQNSINTPEQQALNKKREVIIKAKTGEILSDNKKIFTEEELKASESQESVEELEGKAKIEEDDEDKLFNSYTEEDYKNANLGIIITEIGGKQQTLEIAKQLLPKETAFAFTPYSDDLNNKLANIKAQGSETLLNLMFEPSNFPINDTGPLTILTYFEEGLKAIKLQETLKKAKDYKGVMTNYDEIMTHNYENILPILKILRNKDLYFSFIRKPVNAYLENDVKPLALDVAIIDYLVDANLSEQEILKRLKDIKYEITENKKKIVIALRPYPVSIETVSKWLQENLENKDIQIAPLSYFIIDN